MKGRKATRKVLWAPWRMEYIGSEPKGCIFCSMPQVDRDEENLILERGRLSFVAMNRFPYNNGHLMVAPYAHVPSLEDLSEEAVIEVMRLVKKSLSCLRATLHPQGFNVGVNIGRAAGAGFDQHVHVHVVPRWTGDINFMPVLADTKVLPEALNVTYRKLRPSFSA
ncbi:MAG: HIT domain-containing protein, partial [Candidatus Bathyarchaeia archaeon]